MSDQLYQVPASLESGVLESKVKCTQQYGAVWVPKWVSDALNVWVKLETLDMELSDFLNKMNNDSSR